MFKALLGGALIGAAATLYWAANRRVAGVSGVLAGALRASGERTERVLFLLGLFAAGAVAARLHGAAPAVGQPAAALVVAGLLVGLGTRVGGGCTSGHGVCGLSRFQSRSLVATLTFMATAAVTVFVVARLLPGWSVR